MREEIIEALLTKAPQSTLRLQALADRMKTLLEEAGLPNVQGGSTGELTVPGLARQKNWDVAYEFAGKFRLLISLKSILKNLSGTVPNRLDDLQGELANVQHLRPEIVIGYVVLVDTAEDAIRQVDGKWWSDFFEESLAKISIRKAPLWNQGLMEAVWFVKFDSRLPFGSRIVDPSKVAADRDRFIDSLLRELEIREPAVPFSRPLR